MIPALSLSSLTDAINSFENPREIMEQLLKIREIRLITEKDVSGIVDDLEAKQKANQLLAEADKIEKETNVRIKQLRDSAQKIMARNVSTIVSDQIKQTPNFDSSESKICVIDSRTKSVIETLARHKKPIRTCDLAKTAKVKARYIRTLKESDNPYIIGCNSEGHPGTFKSYSAHIKLSPLGESFHKDLK